MRDWSVNDMTGMPLVLGAAWKNAACAICSVEELHNCPEEKCTADLQEGALLDTWDSCAGKGAGRQCDMRHSDWFSRVDGEGGITVQTSHK